MSSFLDNFCTLRKTIIKMLVVFLLAIAILSPFTKEIFDLFMKPFSHIISADRQFLSVAVTSPVLVPLKILLFFAFLISLPFNLYLIWRFISPGLFKKERKIAISFVIMSVLMFLCGLIYCYYVVFPLVFSFINEFSPENVQFAPDIDESLGFIMHLFIAFGFGFEIPVLVVFLNKTGLVNLEKLKKCRRYIIVAAFAISAIITPPDVTSQLLLAVPAIALYEIGIILCTVFYKKKTSLLTVINNSSEASSNT